MKVVIIGGGISGCFCAIELARSGIDVTILERKERILKKMLATGNGRCNLTNNLLNYNNYNNPDFVKPAIDLNGNDNFRSYLKTIGLLTVKEELNRIYPISLKAQSVVNLMLKEIKDLGIKVYLSSPVLRIVKDDKFSVYTNEDEFTCDALVYAAGGASAPNFGTDGKSFGLLKALGHNISHIYPSLTQIKLDSEFLKQLSGVKVVGEASLYKEDQLIKSDFGEILFTNYGLSGPPILNLSKYVNLKGADKITMPLINIFDSIYDLKDSLYSQFYMLSHFTLERWLQGLVDKKLINLITKSLFMDKDQVLSTFEEEKVKELIEFILGAEFRVTGTRGFENSHVSSGGLSLKEVDPYTMRSIYVDGLYIIGEALDIDGDCGGYNIQWAFSSAMICAKDIK
ncbi:aminoacetone oxidase family FAD-binding enzyme [Peptoniphilus catoniae]|uniref:aminoacetone oxidase family FAD-binding enzyme n=1 Tax=Peptoniphilus catoniae TaxID=1660341 RepID=UPI0010FE41B0|nr:aminoacetone oxidase family FAD-binding enzyme [Peptoniphilus catoniae]